jgi:hypothetical protein
LLQANLELGRRPCGGGGGDLDSVTLGSQVSKRQSQFKYLGMTVTNQNLIEEENKRRQNTGMLAAIQSGNFCLLVCYFKT